MNNVAIMADETSSSSSSLSSSMMMTQAFKKVKKEDTSSDSDSDSDSDNNNEDFFEDWKVGNWCWERDYNKYPVVSFPNHNNNRNKCHNNDNNDSINSSRSSKRTIKEESCDDGQYNDDVQLGDDNDIGIDDDEKKPAAIKSSAFDSSRVRTTTTTTTTSAIEITAATTKMKNARKIAGCRIKTEKNEDISIIINGHNNSNNNNDDDDDDDDSFYDDWVEGNWGMLNNCDINNNNNNEDDGDDNKSPCKIQHQTPTTLSRRSRKKSRYNNNANNHSTKHNEADKIYDEIDDDYEEEEGEEDDPQKDNNDVRNHQKDNRRSRGRSRQGLQNEIWMGMFEKLVAYKNKHKNTMVPQRYDEDPKLGRWVTTQRRFYKNDELSPKRLALLNSIGFACKGVVGGQVDNEKWMNMFEKLVAYKNNHKNTMVPQRYDEDPKLGRWVTRQRQAYKNDELSPKRLALLISIGFACKGVVGGQVDNEKWMNMFRNLVEYKKQHKNTMVPKRYEKDPKLGWWIGKQRQAYKNDELLPKRLALLNSIDFNWVAPRVGKVHSERSN